MRRKYMIDQNEQFTSLRKDNKKQKPWSELTDSEKKTRIITITPGVVLLVTGVVFFLFRFLT